MIGGAWLTDSLAFALKFLIALATTLLLLVDLLLRRAKRGQAFRRVRAALLLGLGVAGWLGWWNFFGAPVLTWVHEHDGLHYFLGAKYFDELGYTRMYQCVIAADVEAGLGAGLETRRLRDLATNQMQRGAALADDAQTCRARFAPERWQAFARDVAWFRGRLAPADWQRIGMDHGFNGSPVWLLAGSALTNAVGSAESGYLWLARIDYGLLVAMWIGVLAAFGWRTTCVAAVFWGTNGFAVFDWTGGSLLRQDWLVALVLGIACLRRGRPALAGALLTLSTLLRVFPGIAVAALALQAGLLAWRRRSLRPPQELVRFAGGCALALALLVPLTVWQHGAGAWGGFAANSRKLLGTPLLNQMGLRPAVLFEPSNRARVLEDPEATDPMARWKRAQHEQLAQRGWIVALLTALYLALLARALPRLESWGAVALGVGAIPIATALTCYYHAALLALALLSTRREAVGVALCALAAVSQWIWSKSPYADVPFVWMSVAEVLTVVFVTWLFAAPAPSPRPADAVPAR